MIDSKKKIDESTLSRLSKFEEEKKRYALQKEEKNKAYAEALNAVLQGTHGPDMIRGMIEYCGVYSTFTPKSNYEMVEAQVLRKFYLDMIRKPANKDLLMTIEKEIGTHDRDDTSI